MLKQVWRVTISIWALMLPILAAHGQGTTTDFGQNRVQYKNFEWSFFDSEHFTTYFYLGGQDIGRYSIIYSESVLNEIEQTLEYRMTKKIEIMVYNDLSDLNQTNIGIGLDLNNPGGLTKLIDNKLFVYFDGDHAHLERQIRQGIAQIMIQHIMFGTNFQEVVQNAVLLNLPTWFTDGVASYIGRSWSTEDEDRLRDGIMSGKYKKVTRLKGDDARFVGHAIWHYVEMKYGRSAVGNLLYLTRINRSLESGFLFVLGGSLDTVLEEWYNSLKAEYTKSAESREYPVVDNLVKKRKWKLRHHYQPRMSNDGKYVAYVTNIMGKYRVHVSDVAARKTKRVMGGGHKTNTLVTDYSYPLLAWSPDKRTLAIIFNRRDKLKMILYNAETGEKDRRDITKFQQIHDFSFAGRPDMLVMSAVQAGQTDIFTYQLPNTTVEQITNDYYDDLYPAVIDVQGRMGIVFSSNRPTDTLFDKRMDTTLLGNNYDLFFYNMKQRSKILSRLTFTEYSNEFQPMQYSDSLFTFLTDRNGINNRYLGYFKNITIKHDTTVFFEDSIITNPKWDLAAMQADPENIIDSVRVNPVRRDIGVTFPGSNYSSSVVEHDLSPVNKSTLEMFREDGQFKLYISKVPSSPTKATAPQLDDTEYKHYYKGYMEKERLKSEAKKMPKEVTIIIKDEESMDSTATQLPMLPDSTKPKVVYFQNDWNTSPNLVVASPEPNTVTGTGGEASVPGATGNAGTGGQGSVFKVTQVLPYRVKFATSHIVTQVDNSLIMTRYDVFRPGVPVFNNPQLGAMLTLGITDLFEDHKITGGMRFPFNFQGSEYFIAYEHLKRRIDTKVMYYRRVDVQRFSPSEELPFVGSSAPASYPANLAINAKVKTNYFELRFKYPFNVLSSLRFYMAYRNENYVYQSTERFTLELPNYNSNWLFAKLEFVHDQTIKVATNLHNGFRFKLWAEIHKQFTIEDQTIANSIDVPLPSFDNRYFAVFGGDFRYYQKIHREITWCNRVAIGTSVGTRKVVFYLGGVDNWILPGFNRDVTVNENNNYAFQTTVTNMRGFDQNIRNGNSYAVLNSEIRWPIFSYFIRRNIRSNFVKDFQLIGFTDVGTAWEGVDPYGGDSPLIVDEIERDPVTVRVEYFRDPIVVGYGMGIRSTLFGYYFRFDVAWGRDSGQTGNAKYYFSLTKDF